jgi:hypothetical protein
MTMQVRDLFLRLRTALEAAGVDYMLTGSFAGAVHGAVRATQDIDIVIAPTRKQLLALLDQFPDAEYYVDRAVALDALSRRGQFNVIDATTGWKVDFIIRQIRDFSLVEFDRRSTIEMSGVRLSVASAEDVIVSKLEWAKLGASARQLEDVVGIIRMQAGSLDIPYIERWVKELGLEREWREACSRAK